MSLTNAIAFFLRKSSLPATHVREAAMTHPTFCTFWCLFARVLLVLVAFSYISAGSYASAEEYDLCARGLGDNFTRTVHVVVTYEGEDLKEARDLIFGDLINRTIWYGRARDIFLENYDAAICTGARGLTQKLTLTLTKKQVEEIQRGEFKATRGGEEEKEHLTLRIYYATNRQDTGGTPSERFTSAPAALSFGAAEVSIPKDHRMGELETPSIIKFELSEDPDKHIAIKSVLPLTAKAWKDDIKKRATALGKPGILLFVHGYNVSFADAAMRTAQMAYDLAFPGPAVFFSWPSKGSLVKYFDDEKAAANSAGDLTTVLSTLSDMESGVPVYVIAHSMGNRILSQGLAVLLEQDSTRRHAFQEIIMTAPDISAKTFSKEIAPKLLGAVKRVTLYASSNDVALAASRKAHKERRLGESGDGLTVLKDMHTVDASNVKTDFLGHSYYADTCTLLGDLFSLIHNRKGPDERFALEKVTSAKQDPYWRFRR
jgi:esterase/lipase superfamily enzyme